MRKLSHRGYVTCPRPKRQERVGSLTPWPVPFAAILSATWRTLRYIVYETGHVFTCHRGPLYWVLAPPSRSLFSLPHSAPCSGILSSMNNINRPLTLWPQFGCGQWEVFIRPRRTGERPEGAFCSLVFSLVGWLEAGFGSLLRAQTLPALSKASVTLLGSPCFFKW